MSKRKQAASIAFEKNKKLHEESILIEFIKWCNNTGKEYEIISFPDPPDAIVINKTTGKLFWVEATTSYFSGSWAQDLKTFSNPHVDHAKMAQGLYKNMDKELSRNLIRILQKKLSKKNYKSAFEEYGSGMLVIKTQTPWAIDKYTFMCIHEQLNSVKNTTGYFDSIYIYHPAGFTQIVI